MVELIKEYTDTIIYKEKIIEIAWRRGSIEVNTAESSVNGLRIYRDGYWRIASIQGDKNSPDNTANHMIKRLLRVPVKRYTHSGYIVGGEWCDGSYKLGSPPNTDELLRLMEHIVDKIEDGEVVVLAGSIIRRIENKNTVCNEEKHFYEILVYAEKNINGRRSVGSSSLAFTGELNDAWKLADNLAEEAVRRAEAGLRARRLGLLESGKWIIILGYEASGAFFHELAHLLEGDQPDHLRIGERISTTSINVYDDPLYPWSPATRMFDDEAVKAVRKPLVEDGEVVELLHTRESAAQTILKGYNALPGQARGLFHKPKAMHTTLVVEPGDWKVKELVEESRRTILVDGIIRAELYGQTVTIIPETAWLVDRELKEPVRIRVIRLPLIKALTTIDAMTRTSKLRYSYEKGHIVAEIAPIIRLQGVVEV